MKKTEIAMKVFEVMGAIPLVDLVDGTLAVSIADLAGLSLVPWFCDASIQWALRLTMPGSKLKKSLLKKVNDSFIAATEAGAVLIGADQFLYGRRGQLIVRTARHALPSISQWREFAAAGSLMSYGTNVSEAWRQAAVYVGRVLKGEKPAVLPVQQAVKVELVINLNTANAIGVTLPLTLLGRADEVIE